MRRLLLAAAAAAAALAPTAPARTCRTLVVTRRRVAFPHFRTIGAAVDAAHACDWVLVARGTYRGSVTIRTPGLHLRGVDRNGVVLDGGGRAGNGIVVQADGVSVENLTVRDFDRRSLDDDRTGNEILWRGVRGFTGRYLTAYDTGLLGGYGLYAARSSGGEWDHVYASGFVDSGLYVGACRNCETTISDALAERNALGLSASNASGRFVVERSTFRDNTIGASPNSTESDPPPPQLGTCDAGANRSPTPRIATTALARCTIFRDDRFVGNDNLTVRSDTASVRPGWGIGMVLLGSYGDLVTADVFEGNRNAGIIALELPYRRPPRPGTISFQLAGNRFSDDVVRGSRLAFGLEGGRYGSRRSVDDCLSMK